MRFLITFDVRDTIVRAEDITRVRKAVGDHAKGLLASGKIKESGVWADGRGGFLLAEVGTADDLHDLLNAPFIEFFNVRSRPVVTFEKLARFFQEHPVV
jgi:hypothetical protein